MSADIALIFIPAKRLKAVYPRKRHKSFYPEILPIAQRKKLRRYYTPSTGLSQMHTRIQKRSGKYARYMVKK
jgi:hypothetical protein